MHPTNRRSHPPQEIDVAAVACFVPSPLPHGIVERIARDGTNPIFLLRFLAQLLGTSRFNSFHLSRSSGLSQHPDGFRCNQGAPIL